jgi:hypothetical protein
MTISCGDSNGRQSHRSERAELTPVSAQFAKRSAIESTIREGLYGNGASQHAKPLNEMIRPNLDETIALILAFVVARSLPPTLSSSAISTRCRGEVTSVCPES